MLRRLTRTLIPRGYEMNATGTIPPAVVARYLEHSRWDSVTDPAFPLRTYWSRGVIRAQRIQLLSPLRFAQEIRITICLSKVGRSSLEFSHRIERADGGELLARAAATGVNLGADGRPTPLPLETRELVVDEPVLELPAPPQAAGRISYTRNLVVVPSDQDVQQHVNQARYIDFVEDTRALAARDDALGDEHRPAAGAALQSLVIEYSGQARFGDELRIVCWGIPGEPTGFAAEIRRAADDELMTRARISTQP